MGGDKGDKGDIVMTLTGYIRTSGNCFGSTPPRFEADSIKSFCFRQGITLAGIWSDYAEAGEFCRLNQGLNSALVDIGAGVSAGLVVYQISLPLMLCIEYLTPSSVLILPVVGPSLDSGTMLPYCYGIGSPCYETH